MQITKQEYEISEQAVKIKSCLLALRPAGFLLIIVRKVNVHIKVWWSLTGPIGNSDHRLIKKGYSAPLVTFCAQKK